MRIYMELFAHWWLMPVMLITGSPQGKHRSPETLKTRRNSPVLHWTPRVIIMSTLLPLVALDVVITGGIGGCCHDNPRCQQRRHSWHYYNSGNNPDKVHGANMGPIWGRQDPGGPHAGPWTLPSGKKEFITSVTLKTESYHNASFVATGCTRGCGHWWHWRLLLWQPRIPTVMTKLASLQLWKQEGIYKQHYTENCESSNCSSFQSYTVKPVI